MDRRRGERAEVGLLADGGNHRAHIQPEVAVRNRDGAAPPAGVGPAQFGLETFQILHLAGLAPDLNGHGEKMDLDPFLQGLFHLFRVGRHLFLGAAVGHVDFFIAQAHTGAGRVHGRIAAADDHHLVGQAALVPQVDLAEEGDDIADLGKIVFTFDFELIAQMGPDAQEEGLKALVAQFLQGNVGAHGDVGYDFHPQGADEVDFCAHYLPGQAIFGNAGHKEAARFGHGFENRYSIALKGQIMGARQARRARAHDGDLVAIVGPRYEGQIFAVAGGPIGHKGLEVLDVQGLIQMAPDAGPFAGVRADEAADPGEGVVLADHFQSLQETPLAHQSHRTGDIDARGAGYVAGRGQQLGADPGRAVLFVRVQPVFIREELQGSEDGVDGLAAQVARGFEPQAFADGFQFFQGLAGGLTAGNLGQQLLDVEQTRMAGGALGPGLVQEKVNLLAHQSDDAVLFVQDLDDGQGQGGPQFPEGFVIQADLEEIGGKNAAQGAAHQDGLGDAAVAETAAHAVDYLLQGGGQGHLHKAGLLHGTGETENHGAGGAGNTQLAEPGNRGLGDEGQ